LASVLATFVLFSSYSRALDYLKEDLGNSWTHFKAGALSGVAISFVTCPVELLKIQLQTGQSSKNIFRAARTTIVNNGILGLYRGLGITLLREIPSFAAYFGTYTAIKSSLSEDNSMGPIIAGAAAGIAAWLPCYPQDVIKSLIQSSPEKLGIIQATRIIYSRHGYAGFLRGLSPTLLRALPANAATFTAYEFVKSLLE
jgi:solute carrier family 25 (mitochondrial carnitine/acylcarnitine transporter), member 20/29